MKTILLFLIFSLSLFAKDYTLKLYEEILSKFASHTPVVVYADAQSAKILKKSRRFIVLHYCSESVDFLVGSHFGELSSLCQDKPLFATSYRAYHRYENAFGAFYWTKGRPQIHFNKRVLERFSLPTPYDLKRYIDE